MESSGRIGESRVQTRVPTPTQQPAPTAPTPGSSAPLGHSALLPRSALGADAVATLPQISASTPRAGAGAVQGTQSGVIEMADARAVERAAEDIAIDIAPAVVANVHRQALQALKQEHAATQATFDAFKAHAFVQWAPSASAGASLHGLNDHAGVLVVRAHDGDHSVAERLAVVKDDSEGAAQYFVKGYGDRIVPFEALANWVVQHQHAGDPAAAAGDAAPAAVPMETALRTELRRLSEESGLQARRDTKESADVVMPTPPDLAALPWRQNWANAENMMPKGFGPLRGSGPDGTGEPARTFFMDYNGIENRLIVFKRDDQRLERTPQGGEPTAVNLNGPILAEIQGIKSMEVMGPAGAEPGVKNATLMSAWTALCGAPAAGERRLRVTTEDGAVHQLRLTERGVEMQLANPKPSIGQSAAAPAFGGGARVGADVDVYSYQGRDTGTKGSVDGFADPQLVLSSGEALAAGPLLHDRAGALGAATSLAHAALRIVTVKPQLGEGRSGLAYALNTAVTAVSKAVIVSGFNVALKTVQALHANHTLLGGGRQFSGSGRGTVETKALAGAIFSMVLAQEAVSAGFELTGRLLKPIMPDVLTERANRGSTFLMDCAIPAAQEMCRLMTNYGIQKDWHVPRGNNKDLSMLIPQAAVSGLIEFTRRRAGAVENHPAAHGVLLGLDFANDTLMRSLGNVLGSSRFDSSYMKSDFAEAVVSRLLTRSGDKLVLPVVALVLNEAGVIGPNASAFDHQTSREAGGLPNAVAALKNIADLVDRAVHDGVDAAPAVRSLLGGAEHVLKEIQKRSEQVKLTARGTIAGEVEATEAASRFPRMTEAEQAQHLEQVTTDLEALVESSRTGAGPQPTYSARSQLPPAHQGYMARLGAAEAADPERPYPVNPGLDGRARPRNARVPGLPRALVSDTDRVPRDYTTFSDTAQRYAMGTHAAMAAVPGVQSVSRVAALGADVKSKIFAAVRDYTGESQFFHYPLRWPVTGQPRLQEVAPGIAFSYRVMNKPGNTSGAPSGQFDPIQALYINLGALHAEKFPAIVQRAVGTEARYGVPAVTHPRRAVIGNDDAVVLTEILSATMSSRLAASFGQALGFGAARKDQSQRLVMAQMTAVNITKYTDLVQAEIIAMPGGVYTVEHIDADPRKPEGDASADIGQVVYMKSLDTYALERNHPASHPEGGAPALQDGDLAVHPQSGHFYRFDGAENRLKFVTLEKSYFTGSEMERARVATPADAQAMPGVQVGDALPSTELARWRHPYTSDYAPRATKDAIHAAILRGDPIVDHLDDAVQNIHHRHFREVGGFAGSPAEAAENAARTQTRAAAAQVSRAVNALGLDSPLPAVAGAVNQAMVAWLTTSLLRRPIQLVPVAVAADGVPTVNEAQAAVISRTYDNVDLSAERPVAIGTGPGGFYALRHNDGRWTARPVAAQGEGATLGNFLHAYFHTGHAADGQYRDTGGGALRPDGKARQSVSKLLDKVKALAATPYLPLQQAISRQATAQGMPLPAAPQPQPPVAAA